MSPLRVQLIELNREGIIYVYSFVKHVVFMSVRGVLLQGPLLPNV